jgi:hypothetical protein
VTGILPHWNASDLLDLVLEIAIKLLGKDKVRTLLRPYANSMASVILPDLTQARIEKLGAALITYMPVGLGPFMKKWEHFLLKLPDVCLATEGSRHSNSGTGREGLRILHWNPNS